MQQPCRKWAERAGTTERSVAMSAVAFQRPFGQPGFMAKKRWNDLSPRARRLILMVGAVETMLKIAALVDLARRPAQDVRGSKSRWAMSIAIINSGGLVPVAYFARGRRAR